MSALGSTGNTSLRERVFGAGKFVMHLTFWHLDFLHETMRNDISEYTTLVREHPPHTIAERRAHKLAHTSQQLHLLHPACTHVRL